MNKDKLVNYLKKNKWAIISGVGFLIGGYFLLHTNFSYHLEDRTGKYILNPKYKEFHKYEWTDLKSVYPTKLAYDPAWFKLPPDKYIPKEQPIPKEISNISDPIIRRQAYFNFLCKNEYAAYITNDIKGKNLESMDSTFEGVLDLTVYRFFPKTTTTPLNSKTIYPTNSNPFILPVYNRDYIPLSEKDIYNFYFANINNKINYNLGNEDKFKEFISYSGDIYLIKYDSANKKVNPIKKIKESSARYYILEKYRERDNLRNLGIAGYEQIIYDRKEQKTVMYLKQFNMGAFLPWQEEGSISNFSWAKQSGCEFKPQYIDKF